MLNKTIFAALTIALSSTAFAASASNQLALSLGVEPGVYSTSELIQLRDAREDNDLTKARFIERRAVAVSRGTSFGAPSVETVIAAYENGLNNEDGNAENLEHFIAKVKGERPVSAETVAFSKAHLAHNIEDER